MIEQRVNTQKNIISFLNGIIKDNEERLENPRVRNPKKWEQAIMDAKEGIKNAQSIIADLTA